MKKVAIVQSNYIPWKGYFDMIAAVDEFILYDDMQYTRRDWRNRNQVKTRRGVQKLTVASWPMQNAIRNFARQYCSGFLSRRTLGWSWMIDIAP